MKILIDKIHIKNFRALRDIEVDLKPLTILLGTNNAGKTSFLRAFNAVLGISRTMLNKDDLFINQEGKKPENQEIIIDIRIIPVNEKGERQAIFNPEWQNHLGGSDVIMNETEGIFRDWNFFAFRTKYIFQKDDSPKITYTLIRDWIKKILEKEGEFGRISKIRELISVYLIDAQRDILEDTQSRNSFFGRLASKLEEDYDKDALEEIKANIIALNNKAIEKSTVLSHLKETLEKLNQTTKTSGEGVSITPFPKNVRDLHKGLKVNFQDNGSDTFSMEYHGMGTRSWASILTVGAFIDWEIKNIDVKRDNAESPSPFLPILALEEPEAHLHPNGQRTLYNQIKSFKGQKIISTHSPYIVAQAELSELRHFYKFGDKTEISFVDTNALNIDEKRKIEREVLQTQGELLFAKCIVLFEGETEKQVFPIFAEKFFTTSHFNHGILFISTNGNNYSPFVHLAKTFQIPWFIFSDYDQSNIKKGVDNVLKKILGENIDVDNVIKLNQSIENYLVVENYQNELKKGVFEWKIQNNLIENESSPEQHQYYKVAEQKKINEMSDMELLEELNKRESKVRYPIYWANEIINLNNEKQIPPKIKELFEKIAQKLNIEITQENETGII